MFTTPQSTLQNNHVFARGPLDTLGSLLGSAPPAVMEQLPRRETRETLGRLPESTARQVLRNPVVLRNLPAAVVRQYAQRLNASGIFHVRVANYALFSRDPQAARMLARWPVRQFHLETQATPIQRFVEYGPINMPNYWG